MLPFLTQPCERPTLTIVPIENSHSEHLALPPEDLACAFCQHKTQRIMTPSLKKI